MIFFTDKCKKDILIVLDMSNSIGRDPFIDNARPFLLNLVKQLNIDRVRGSQLAMIIFSSKDKTRVFFNFNELTTKAEIIEKIGSMSIEQLGGTYTRTGLAFNYANTKVHIRSIFYTTGHKRSEFMRN